MNKRELIKVAKRLVNGRSRWDKGVKYYIEAIVERAQFERNELNKLNFQLFKKRLLNGADDWMEVSLGGCFLINDKDIAKTLALKSQRTKIGVGTVWLEHQARALCQADYYLGEAFCKLYCFLENSK